jgi:DNA helicase-2/ATP-dependent DNA helicase PcrA
VVEAEANKSVLDLARNVVHTVDRTDESVMVLFRARYQMFDFIDEFLPKGIPFSCLTDQRMWTDRLTDYVRGVEKLDDGEPLTGLEARRLADMFKTSAFGSNDRDELYDAIEDAEEAADTDDLAEIEIDPRTVADVAPFAPDRASAGDMLRKVTSFQRKSVQAYFAHDYAGMDPARVRVGTIHSAKGREADHVFLSTDLTEKVVEQMAASAAQAGEEPGFDRSTSPVPVLTDNERRVFYVGMSRARERLVILENLINGAPTLPVSVLIHNEIRDEEPQEIVDGLRAEPATTE